MSSFQKRHRRAYILWVGASVLVVISMVAFLFAPFFMY